MSESSLQAINYLFRIEEKRLIFIKCTRTIINHLCKWILQIFWLMILGTWHCTGEKLSPDQKAPLFARGSGGLILNTPFEDNKARNRPISNVNAPVNNVQKEETEMFVYLSRYEADENGNRASFKFGTGVANGDNRSSSSSKSENGRGDKNGRSSYLPPTKKDVDRSYLPPQ